MNIAVIIPAFNEEQTIYEVVERFHEVLPDAYYVVVDNCSKDRTSELANKALLECKAEGTVLYEGRPGKGNAVRHAFHTVDADIYVMVDADLTYHPEDLLKMIEPVKQGKADLVVGDRLSAGEYEKENKRPFHDFGNSLVVGTINKLFKSNLHDVMSGYRVMTRQFVEHTPILRPGFELETETTLFALDNRFRILEIPIKYTDRPDGSDSKLNTFRDGAKVLYTIFRILRDYKPLIFFGTIALFCGILGVALGSMPVYEYFKYEYVYRVPSAIVATGLIVLSGMFIAILLILTTIKNYFRALFEILLIKRGSPAFNSDVKKKIHNIAA